MNYHVSKVMANNIITCSMSLRTCFLSEPGLKKGLWLPKYWALTSVTQLNDQRALFKILNMAKIIVLAPFILS